MDPMKTSSVLVTGANRGLGLELVKQFLTSANPPDQIFATCRDPAGPGAQVLMDLAKKHPNLFLHKMDTADPDSIKEAATQVASQLNGKGLNLLINNAGINSYCTLENSNSEEMMFLYSTNVVGPMLVSKAFLPFLKIAAQSSHKEGMFCGKAAVINISSLFGSIQKCSETFSMAQMYPYRISKAALNMLTRCLSLDLQKENILCVAIHPGWVKTDMGGTQAPLEVSDSIQGMLRVLSSLTEKNTGQFLDWQGQQLPW
ncbi:C-factor [Erpetoichthys calabaricus]|nr:C-factor [Erpetoichthys calabaricus]